MKTNSGAALNPLEALPRRSKDEQVKARPISATVEEVMDYVTKKHHKALAELAKV